MTEWVDVDGPDDQHRPRAGYQRWRRLRDQAADALHSADPATNTIELPAVGSEAELRRTRLVIDLASRVGALTLEVGGSCSDATAATLQVAEAFGLRGVHVDVTFTSVIITHHRGPDLDALTQLRVTRYRIPDYQRHTDLQQLVESISAEDLTPQEARRRFELTATRPRLYRRWVITAATAVLGLGVALLLGGGWREILITVITTAAVDRVQAGMARRRLPAFFGQIAGAAVPTTTMLALTALSEAGVPGLDGLSASVVITAGVVALLAGLSVVSAAQDAIDGFYMTASARCFEVGLMTIGIVLGILGTLWLGDLIGVDQVLQSSSRLTSDPVLQLVAAGVIAAGFAVGSHARIRIAGICVVMGILGWAALLLGNDVIGLGYGTSAGIAAAVVALVAQLAAGRLRTTTLALTTAGIVALLPGSMVYRGLYGVAQANSLLEAGPGVSELVGAAAAGLGLATGVSLGTWLGRPLRLPRGSASRRYERKVLRRVTAPE